MVAKSVATADLVQSVASATDMPQAQAKRAIDALVDTVSACLEDGDVVRLNGLGIFSVVDRAARQGRNPATGEAIRIPASKAVRFKASKTLRDRVSPRKAAAAGKKRRK